MKKTDRKARPVTRRKSPTPAATAEPSEPTAQNLAEIKALIELVAEKQITEFELERGDFRLRIQRGSTAEARPQTVSLPPVHAPAVAPAPAVIEAPQAVASAPAATPAAPAEENLHIITSPIVGTFYRSPSPTADPFVKIGDNIEKGSTICIIEAMKLMNEITSEVSGTVARILVENGQPVEYGQPLFGIKL
ncbi:MAG: acetyl-CoA carboxylase biotin carboxyl carrier protein [Blastocatellia bacterium]